MHHILKYPWVNLRPEWKGDDRFHNNKNVRIPQPLAPQVRKADTGAQPGIREAASLTRTKQDRQTFAVPKNPFPKVAPLNDDLAKRREATADMINDQKVQTLSRRQADTRYLPATVRAREPYLVLC